MGKRFRDRRKALQSNSDQAETVAERLEPMIINYDNVGGFGSDLTPYDSGTYPAYELPGGQQFATPVETFNSGTDGFVYNTTPVGSIRDNIDWEVGGMSGEADDMLYSLGVVSSNTVENFELDGRQQIIRRMSDGSPYGPVGTSDHNALLAMVYAQQVNQYYPNEESQLDLIRAI